MRDHITLNELIDELKRFQKDFGELEVSTIGGCGGMVHGMHSPLSVVFYRNDIADGLIIASRPDDLGKSCLVK